MSSIPSGISRVPTALLTRFTTQTLTRSNLQAARLQEQLATGLAINRPSDDAVAAATISLLNERLERAAQIERNMDHADAALAELDAALGSATDLLLEAKQIALDQSGFSAGGDERASQATIVQSLLDGLFAIANREGVAGHVFGGRTPGSRPVQSLLGGYRFTAGAAGLLTDLGPAFGAPVTLGGPSTLGSASARHRGTVDLDPDLTEGTLLKDLRGARGLGVATGTIELTLEGEEPVQVDLAGARNVGDVLDRIESAIRALEAQTQRTLLGPDGVTVRGERIAIDLFDDGTDQPPRITFADPDGGSTAADLGLVEPDASGDKTFRIGDPEGYGLDPRLTWSTPVASMAAVDEPLASIRVRAAGTSKVIDLSQAETLEDVRNLIEGAGLGLRVEIDEQRDALSIRTDLATGRAGAMAIEELDGNNGTASMLGIRTLDGKTRISDFNDGRGVAVRSGSTDPQSGEPDPARDVDFVVTLGDGFEIRVDLRPEDLTTVAAVLDRINKQAAAQLTEAGRPPAQFSAGLSTADNGLTLTQDPALGGAVSIRAANGSAAAEQLGLLDGHWDQASGLWLGEDRARIRPDNAFTHLLDLRDALENDDDFGISFAAENLEASLKRLAESRALVGGYARRVEQARTHQENRVVHDQSIRSQIRDLDYVQAASQFSLLQTQIQAGYQTAATLNSLSLLDFLG